MTDAKALAAKVIDLFKDEFHVPLYISMEIESLLADAFADKDRGLEFLRGQLELSKESVRDGRAEALEDAAKIVDTFVLESNYGRTIDLSPIAIAIRSRAAEVQKGVTSGPTV